MIRKNGFDSFYLKYKSLLLKNYLIPKTVKMLTFRKGQNPVEHKKITPTHVLPENHSCKMVQMLAR